MSADPKLTEVRFHIWWDAIFPAPPIQKMWKLRWVWSGVWRITLHTCLVIFPRWPSPGGATWRTRLRWSLLGESSWRSFWSRHHTDKRAVPVGVSPRRINKIVHGARCITQTSRCGWGCFFGMGVQFWIDLQSHYDVEDRDGRTARDAGQGTSLVIASGGLMGHYGQSYLSTMTRRGRRQVGSCGRV